MVHSWNYALAVLLATSATTPVTSFQSSGSNHNNIINNNPINHNRIPRRRRQRLPLPTTQKHVKTITATKASLTSMAADASYNDKDANIGDALSSVTNAAVDSIANAVKDEPDVDAQEVARKQEMVQKRQTAKLYQVTLPLVSPSNIGISLCQISKGPMDADLELNLDTLEIETKQTENNDIEMDIAKIQRQIYGEFNGLVVSFVKEKSTAWEAGVRQGDILKRTSATLGKQMWPKSTLEGVKSAISSRNAVADSMEFEFQRLVETVDNQFELSLTKPIGFNLRETEDGYVEVTGFTPKASKLARCAVQPGDRILAVDSSLGERMWPVSTTEGLISAVTTRLPGQKITFRFERRGTTDYDTATIIADGESATIDAMEPSETATVDGVASAASSLDANLLNRCQEILSRYRTDEEYVNKFALQGVVADKVVSALASAETMVDNGTLSMIMTAYLSCRQPEMAIRVFEAVTGLRADGTEGEVESRIVENDPLIGKNGKQIVPNLEALDVYTAGSLMKAHAMDGDLVAMQRVLSVLEGHGGVKMEDFEIASWPGTGADGSLKPDSLCYNVAITAAANSDVEEGMELAKIMFNRLSDPGQNSRLVKDIVSYNAMIKTLTKFGYFEEAIELFYKMKKTGIKPDKYTYTALAKAVMVDDNDVEELLYDMREEGVIADVMTFNTIVRYLCEQKKLSAARKVINFMEASGIPPDSWTYGFLMKGLLDSNNPSACLTLFESACADPRTVGLTDNVYLYTTAMTAAAAVGDHSRAVDLLSRMNSYGIKPNVKTMTALLRACMSGDKPDLAVDIFHRIPNPDAFAVEKGLQALSQAGKGDEALAMLVDKGTIAEQIRGKSLTRIYGALFEDSIRAEDYILARRVMKTLLAKGNIPSKAILQKIFQNMKLTLKDGLVTNVSYSDTGFVKRETISEQEKEKFEFLLFVIDAISDRNLPCEASLYATILQFGNHLGGLPRKMAALLASAKSASDVRANDSMKLIDERSSCEDECLITGWEELFQSFDELRNQIEGPLSLPKLEVRIASRELSRVLKAEKNLSYRKRSLV